MSWRPPSSSPTAEHQDRPLDPYRNRAAILIDDEGIFATIYVQVDLYWRHVSGHLWWRRWSEPAEVIFGLMNFEREDRYTDWLVGPEELDQELSDWEKNKFRYVGDTYLIEWLDDEASDQVRQHMGIDSPGR